MELLCIRVIIIVFGLTFVLSIQCLLFCSTLALFHDEAKPEQRLKCAPWISHFKII